MVGDDVFIIICVIYYGREEYKWVMLLLSEVHKERCNDMCHYVTQLLYELMSTSLDVEYGKGHYQLRALKDI